MEEHLPTAFNLPAIASRTVQEPARLIVGAPLPEFLVRDLAVIQYRTENLRIVPVFGPAALEVKAAHRPRPRTVDDAAWHWVDTSGEQLVIQELEPEPHSVRVDLVDQTHCIIDSQKVRLEIPSKAAAAP